MNTKKTQTIISVVSFVLIGIMLFSLVQAVLINKQLTATHARYKHWKQIDNVDILVLGNSHANGGINQPLLEDGFKEEYGEDMSVFNFSVTGLGMEQIYFLTKELFKTHKPDLVILETYSFLPLGDDRREVLMRRSFDPLPLSLNKIEAINYCIIENHWSYYIPLAKYHSRWKELSKRDFTSLYDPSSWENAGKSPYTTYEIANDPGDGWFEQDMNAITEIREITPTEKECFENLLSLLEQENIDLLLWCVPFKVQKEIDTIEMVKINNYLRENYVANGNIRLLDMNLLWQELNFGYEDLENEGHVNHRGQEKVMDYLFKYLCEHYDIQSYAERGGL